MLVLASEKKMKIKDIVEASTSLGTIGNTTNGKVQINTPGGTQSVDPSQITTGPDGKPTIKLPPQGSQVNVQTAEDMPSDASSPAGQYVQQLQAMAQQYKEPWQQAQIQARIKNVQSGNVPKSATGGAIKVLDPVAWEKQTDPTTLSRILGVVGTSAYSPEYLKQHGMVDRGLSYVGLEEKQDDDTIAGGGGDVGGDATDEFISDVEDKPFTRANRNAASSGSASPLSESDELYKWLTIAGLK